MSKDVEQLLRSVMDIVKKYDTIARAMSKIFTSIQSPSLLFLCKCQSVFDKTMMSSSENMESAYFSLFDPKGFEHAVQNSVKAIDVFLSRK